MKVIIPNLNILNIKRLEEKYEKDLSIKSDVTSNTIELNFDNSFDDETLLNSLDNFLFAIKKKNIYRLTSEYFFDEHNALIKNVDIEHTLTNKEVIFLKNIIMKKRIMTYDEMFKLLWKGKHNISFNSIRLFIKNLKKKLPPKLLVNYPAMGYGLILK